MQKNNEAYLGNQNLKRSNVSIEWSAEHVEEFIKCSKDPLYFIKNYIQIVNIDQGLVPFNLYDFQENIVDTVYNNRFVICKMPRQSGKTTTVAAMLLWYVLFNENYSVAILANKMAQSREILGRIQLAYEHLPKWLQQGVIEWNKGNIELENGSRILASATSSSAIRGGSFNLIYLDEFAFVHNNMQEEFFASVYPTISSGTTSKVLVTSTPNGLNLFYKIWIDSEEGRNSYKRIDVHWSDVPGRDEKWKEETIRNTSEDQFRVEFECEFLGSANTLIAGSKLRQLVHRTPLHDQNHLKVYKEPQEGHMYFITVDTARGLGLDYSAFVVFDAVSPFEIVATYRNNNIPPLVYPNVIREIAANYNDAFVLIETNDIGGQVADILHQELEYEGILSTQQSGRAGVTIGPGFAGKSSLGIKTTKSVKRLGCSNLKTLVESDRLIIPDYQTIFELSSFVSNGVSFEAEEGRHDDLVMCCVLFSWLSSQPYFKDLTDLDIRANLYKEQERLIEDDILPFGFVNAGDNPFMEDVVPETVFDDWNDDFEDVPRQWMRNF